MQTIFSRSLVALLATVTLTCFSSTAKADITVGVDDSTASWLGFMSVSNLPADGGAFQFQGGWGVADLVATFDDGASNLTLTPNTIDDPNEYWYQNTSGTAADPVNPGGPGQLGNKIMEATLFLQIPGGQGIVTFNGTVLANTFTSAHTTRAFIRDFEAGFAASEVMFTDITGTGAFSVVLDTGADTSRVLQYGFQTTGENVWATDTAPFGSVVISTAAVPEPSSLAMLAIVTTAVMGRRRRRS